MVLTICVALLILFAIFILIGATASKEEKAKSFYSNVDRKKVYELRDQGEKFKLISHANDSGTLIAFCVVGVDHLETWKQNRVLALKDNEPVSLQAGTNYVLSVKTKDDVVVGQVPEAYSRVMCNHLSSLVDCYVRAVIYVDDMPTFTCEAYYTDIFAVPKLD